MKYLYIFFFCGGGWMVSGQAQTQPRIKEQPSGVYTSANTPAQVQSLRIEEGKVWLNGRLLPEEELPASLHSVDPAVRITLSLCCNVSTQTFMLNGVAYLLKEGRIIELSPRTDTGASGDDNLQRYFNDLQAKDPQTFENMTKEAQLEVLSRQLAERYRGAKAEKDRREVEDELRLVLDEIFTIKQQNMQNEVRYLQSAIDQLEQRLMDREKLRMEIIDKRMQQLLNYSSLSDW